MDTSDVPSDVSHVEFYHLLGVFLVVGTGVLLVFHCSSISQRKQRRQVQHGATENSSSSGSDVTKDKKTFSSWLSPFRKEKKPKEPATFPHVTIVITPPSPNADQKLLSRDPDADSIGSSSDLSARETPDQGAKQDNVKNSSSDATKGGGDVIPNNNNNNNNNGGVSVQTSPSDRVVKSGSFDADKLKHFQFADADLEDDVNSADDTSDDRKRNLRSAASQSAVCGVTIVAESIQSLRHDDDDKGEIRSEGSDDFTVMTPRPRLSSMEPGTKREDFQIQIKL